MTSALSSFYKSKKIVLWVEDPLTRDWLHHLWQDADLGLLVAAGNDAVRAAVNDAREGGGRNVFGLCDRDFGGTNQGKWLDPTKSPTVFVPEAFEVENFLLDFAGLAALGPSFNRPGHSASHLQAQAYRRVGDGLWWMAVRATLADVRAAVTADFPRHPKLGDALPDRAAARRALQHCLIATSS